MKYLLWKWAEKDGVWGRLDILDLLFLTKNGLI